MAQNTTAVAVFETAIESNLIGGNVKSESGDKMEDEKKEQSPKEKSDDMEIEDESEFYWGFLAQRSYPGMKKLTKENKLELLINTSDLKICMQRCTVYII